MTTTTPGFDGQTREDRPPARNGSRPGRARPHPAASQAVAQADLGPRHRPARRRADRHRHHRVRRRRQPPGHRHSGPAGQLGPCQPGQARPAGHRVRLPDRHGYTVVQHFSRAEWLAKLTPGTAYAKYVAAGSDVAADGLKGSKVEFAIKVSDPAAAASVATSSMTLDGTYLVSSMTMPTTSPSASSPAPAAPATTAPAAPATSAPAAPAGPTVSQQQALDSAQSYLDLGTGFSRAGPDRPAIDSPYGGKFSVADATWAVDHSGADWDAQAVMAAKGYMKMGRLQPRQPDRPAHQPRRRAVHAGSGYLRREPGRPVTRPPPARRPTPPKEEVDRANGSAV